MKVDLPFAQNGPAILPRVAQWSARCDTDRLTAVLVAEPDHLELVPCNSVSEKSIAEGGKVDLPRAHAQHRALVRALEDEEVTVVRARGRRGLPDLTFTRDSAFMTPWGLLGLNPGAGHRRNEVDVVLEAARAEGVPIIGRIGTGRIEGGDIAILREGLVVIGVSGARTDHFGALALRNMFERRGWECLSYRLDPHFLHLDTIFTMVGPDLALGCVEVLDDAFLERIRAEGITIIPQSYKECRLLGCNALALGDRRVLMSDACPGTAARLAEHGYRAIVVTLDQFTQCGGGVHCLTMPLSREV